MELLLTGVDLGGDRVNALAVVTTEFVCGGGIVLTFGFFPFSSSSFREEAWGRKTSDLHRFGTDISYRADLQ